ncbi:MAG: hypothetical protein BWY93_01575 [Euryarchaeota archaeon ADurb.BinA087]|nr:MAG: hypothetical protein BWY93_01575 [Euryarchaeota archaeon ADurb.BinA087]
MAPMVRKTAIGSLLADSSSRSGRSIPFRLALFVRKMEKTAAASVDDTTAPRRNPSSSDTSNTTIARPAIRSAVSRTPMVERTAAWGSTGLTSDQRVSSPPEKRM